MQRLHVHINVEDLAASVRFYSALFNVQPSLLKDDYAKWMLDDPCVNFAISNRGRNLGLDHLGIQAQSDEELQLLKQRLQKAQAPVKTEEGVACCYARSDKHWTLDPAGIAWETFHTLDSVPTFNGMPEETSADETACCSPSSKSSSSACC